MKYFFVISSLAGLSILMNDVQKIEGHSLQQKPVYQLADTTFNLSATDEYVNVMGRRLPALPAFPAVTKQPGKLRGYVKDVKGQPLEGAYIGVRSSAIGGLYSAASAETDAKGYYEISVPWGAAHFYAAGYTIDYGEGRAGLSLYPADGKAGNFTSTAGEVENFVLLPYGIINKDDQSERPWYSPNYIGGAIRISYALGAPNDMWAEAGSLPENSEIEIVLKPDGDMMDPTSSRNITIRKKTGNLNLYINNIPVGRYRISARLTNGKPLQLSTTGYIAMPQFGLQPKEAKGEAQLLLTPKGAKALNGNPDHGSWDCVNIRLKVL
jgi:hypothetical protein